MRCVPAPIAKKATSIRLAIAAARASRLPAAYLSIRAIQPTPSQTPSLTCHTSAEDALSRVSSQHETVARSERAQRPLDTQ